ncbi:MAG: thioredoxin family protein [Saprospiraceae bacterium]
MRLILISLMLSTGLMWAQPTPRAGQLIKVNPPSNTLMPEKSSGGKQKTSSLTTSNRQNPESGANERATAPTTNPAPANANVNATTSNTGRTYNTNTRNSDYTPPTSAPTLAKPEPVGVQWMTIEEAMLLQKGEKRKIFVDVYTDWCSWCKKMDQSTFSDPEVAAYLNSHYYPVRFNAEQTESIEYKDKTYRFVRNGNRGYHELSAEWLQNRLSFPTVVFLDENLNLIQPLPGYQDAEKLQVVLEYFGTDSHRKTPWETFEKQH